MGNPSSRPKYGPGNTVVGEPIFLPDDAFPQLPDAELPYGPPPDLGLPYAPVATRTPTPAPAGASPIAPTTAAEATTGEADGYGYGYQPNVSTPYPSAPIPMTPYPSSYGPQAPSPYGAQSHGAVPPPPQQVVARPRVEHGGPSLVAIAAISFVVIGALTTGAFLVSRSGGAGDDVAEKQIATASPGGEAPATAVPVEDPNSAAGSIPSEAPTAAKTVTRRPGYNGPSNNRRPQVPPRVRPSLVPTATAAPPTPGPQPNPTPDPNAAPTAPQPNPGPDAPPASSGRHRRGG